MKNFLQTLIIIITFSLSSVINALAEFINCVKLNDEKFNSNYLIVRCSNNENYLFWRNFFIIPSFFIYVFVLPVSAFLFMYKNRHKLFNLNIVSKISVLLNGYNKDSYYW